MLGKTTASIMKDLPQLHSEATHAVLLTTLRLLHERGILPLQDVASGLESQAYANVAALDHEANPVLREFVDQLQQLADAYPPRGKPSAGPNEA